MLSSSAPYDRCYEVEGATRSCTPRSLSPGLCASPNSKAKVIPAVWAVSIPVIGIDALEPWATSSDEPRDLDRSPLKVSCRSIGDIRYRCDLS